MHEIPPDPRIAPSVTRQRGGRTRRERTGASVPSSRTTSLSSRTWPGGPASEGAAVLRLEPWRVHVADAMTVATPGVWKPVPLTG
jgi:hypothetical protein